VGIAIFVLSFEERKLPGKNRINVHFRQIITKYPAFKTFCIIVDDFVRYFLHVDNATKARSRSLAPIKILFFHLDFT